MRSWPAAWPDRGPHHQIQLVVGERERHFRQIRHVPNLPTAAGVAACSGPLQASGAIAASSAIWSQASQCVLTLRRAPA